MLEEYLLCEKLIWNMYIYHSSRQQKSLMYECVWVCVGGKFKWRHGKHKIDNELNVCSQNYVTLSRIHYLFDLFDIKFHCELYFPFWI